MKTYFLLFLIGITFVSCSNDDDNNAIDAPTSAKIIGNWNWIVSHGGFGNWTYTPASTGDTQRLEITSTTFKRYINNELITESNYTIELRESILTSGLKEMLISEENEFRTIIEFIDNKLVLSGDCYDCFGSEFVRE